MTEAPVRTKKSMQPKQVRPYTADDTLTHGVTRGDLLLRCLERAKIELGDCLLDVGCGYGGISIAYARTGRAAISIDINPSNIAVLQSRLDAGEAGPGMRADERLAAGDMEGEAVWFRIVKAIAELLSEERPDDAEVH